MQFLKKNIWTLGCLVLFAVLAFTGSASANTDLVGIATTKTKNTFAAVKTIIFIIGGFGLVGLAFSAIFGKMKWTWFASLAVGLAILAAAGAIVEYATGDKRPGLSSDDTFGNI